MGKTCPNSDKVTSLENEVKEVHKDLEHLITNDLFHMKLDIQKALFRSGLNLFAAIAILLAILALFWKV